MASARFTLRLACGHAVRRGARPSEDRKRLVPAAILHQLFVPPMARGLGEGRKLLDEVLAWADAERTALLVAPVPDRDCPIDVVSWYLSRGVRLDRGRGHDGEARQWVQRWSRAGAGGVRGSALSGYRHSEAVTTPARPEPPAPPWVILEWLEAGGHEVVRVAAHVIASALANAGLRIWLVDLLGAEGKPTVERYVGGAGAAWLHEQGRDGHDGDELTREGR